jgi:hypothetical protein
VVVSPIAARLSPIVPTFLAPLLSIVAAFLSDRLPISKIPVAKRLTNLRLLATHAIRPGYCKNDQKK